EFVEGEPHGEAVEQRPEPAFFPRERREKQDCRRDGEQKNSVIEMMNVGPAAWKKRFGIRRVMIRITQTREITKVRRNAMNASRARCRTGRGGGRWGRVTFACSSFQCMGVEAQTTVTAGHEEHWECESNM